ncbi:hypothetical protein [Salinimicrobium sp. GXAS 041]|uniref:hypothetical protein n=1 Tax=Salinimicrobium sp. GXAS 041 TaxID=3400806 RepID=UPI003C7347F6
MENDLNLWWGYKHTNGSYQVKRYFDMRDLGEAAQSPFVQHIHGPFKAENRIKAIEEIERVFEN